MVKVNAITARVYKSPLFSTILSHCKLFTQHSQLRKRRMCVDWMLKCRKQALRPMQYLFSTVWMGCLSPKMLQVLPERENYETEYIAFSFCAVLNDICSNCKENGPLTKGHVLCYKLKLSMMTHNFVHRWNGKYLLKLEGKEEQVKFILRERFVRSVGLSCIRRTSIFNKTSWGLSLIGTLPVLDAYIVNMTIRLRVGI